MSFRVLRMFEYGPIYRFWRSPFLASVFFLTFLSVAQGQTQAEWSRSVREFFAKWNSFSAEYHHIHEVKGDGGKLLPNGGSSGKRQRCGDRYYFYSAQKGKKSAPGWEGPWYFSLSEYLLNEDLSLFKVHRSVTTDNPIDQSTPFSSADTRRVVESGSHSALLFPPDDAEIARREIGSLYWFPFSGFCFPGRIDLSSEKLSVSKAASTFQGHECLRVRTVCGSEACVFLVAPELDFAPVKFEEPYDYELIEFEDDWSTMKWVYTSETAKSECRWFNVVRPIDTLSGIKYPPPNGGRVSLITNPQIKAQWINGEVVRTYNDEALEKLADVSFSPPPVIGRRITILCIFLVVCAIGIATRTYYVRK